jgi:phosphatidylglycerophosphatase C
MSEAAGAPAPATRPVVLFDFDGVLFRGDAFTALMRAHFRRQWWRGLLALPLVVCLSPLSVLRRTRWRLVRMVVHVALLGLDEARYRAIATRFARGLALDSRHFLAAGLRALRRHQLDARVIVVTGCEETLARALLDELGLADVELVASRLVARRSGLRVGVHNVGKEKLRQLARAGVVPPWRVAYGDSLADVAMLAAAESPVLVNTGRKLRAAVARRIGRDPAVELWD